MKNVNKINQIESTGRVFSYMRWSSEPQTWGDSERRQLAAAEAWCQRNGRTLATQTFADRGVSGWKGVNRQSGALGALLKTVAPGDCILVEDTDRWSREKPLDSLNALRDTVNRDIEIVFLKTGLHVNKGNFDEANVIIPMFFGSFLANQENEKRSYRIRQAMDARREKVKAGKAVLGTMPCWLQWEGDKESGKPVVVEEKAQAVRQLFKLSLEGLGVMSILWEMQHANIPCPSNGKKRSKWNTRLIHRLLTDKAVIGYCNRVQPAIPNIYPSIVSEADFYASAEKLKNRRNFTAPIKYENNSVFTGLAKCSICNGSLIKTRCGHNGRYYDYLCCASGVLDRGEKRCKCHAIGMNYQKLENSFLALLLHEHGLIRKAMSTDKQPSPLDQVRGELASIQQECNKIMGMIDGMDTPPQRLADRLAELETRERELQKNLDASDVKAKARKPTSQAYEKFAVEFATRRDDPEYRRKMRLALREIIHKVVVVQQRISLWSRSRSFSWSNGIDERIGRWGKRRSCV